jgi:F-box-like
MPAYTAFDTAAHFFDSAPKQYHDNFSQTTELDYIPPKPFGHPTFTFTLQYTLSQTESDTESESETESYSPFDSVPYEILDQIIGLVHEDVSRDIYDDLKDISACCLVSKQFHAVAVNRLYRHVPISDPYAFTKVCDRSGPEIC